MIETLTYENKERLCKALNTLLFGYRCTFHRYSVDPDKYEFSECAHDEHIDSITLHANCDEESGAISITSTKFGWTISYPDATITFLETGNGVVIQQNSLSGKLLTWTILRNRRENL